MSPFDYIFILIVLIFGVLGLLFGIVKTFSKFFIFLIPIFISFFGASKFYDLLISNFNFYNGHGSYFISSILLYIILFFLSKLFFFLIESLLSYLNLILLNRLLGFFVGLILGSVVGIIFLIVMKEILDIKTFFYNEINRYLSFFFTI